jgi:murein DD-endopeptidase MepM/ murein hydrolase activator NlpD
MIKNLSSLVPNGHHLSQSYRFRISRRSVPRATETLAFSVLCLILCLSSASAQTRARRADEKPAEKAPAGATASGQNAKPATQTPLVRKTAMTYTPRTETPTSAKRPALVNDVTIISLAAEESKVTDRLPGTSLKAGSTRNTPSIWPVIGPLRSGFGGRSNPFGGSSYEFHKGQDISAPWGTPVVATADGVVTIAGWLRGYGWVVYVDHGNGLSTRYGHLSRIDVEVGRTLKRGEQLGLVGSTGRSTGPHLHYEVRINGEAINPIPYLPMTTITTASTPPAAQ